MGISQLTLSVQFDVRYQLSHWSPVATGGEEGEAVCSYTIVARNNTIVKATPVVLWYHGIFSTLGTSCRNAPFRRRHQSQGPALYTSCTGNMTWAQLQY